MEKTAITCDVECYPNYFLVTLYRVSDGATVYIDMRNNIITMYCAGQLLIALSMQYLT